MLFQNQAWPRPARETFGDSYRGRADSMDLVKTYCGGSS